MSKSPINLQDTFLNQLRKETIPVILYLTSGVQLRGHVKGFDAFTVILEGQGKPPQMVYKHSIVSVAPMRHPSTLFGAAAAAAPAEEQASAPAEPPEESAPAGSSPIEARETAAPLGSESG